MAVAVAGPWVQQIAGSACCRRGGRQACCNHDMLLFRGMNEGFQASPPNSAVERCVSL